METRSQIVLDIILKRDLSADEIPTKEEKSASFTYVTPVKERSRTNSERSNTGESFQPRNPSEVRDGDIPRCINGNPDQGICYRAISSSLSMRLLLYIIRTFLGAMNAGLLL